jgi:hypothetical protein
MSKKFLFSMIVITVLLSMAVVPVFAGGVVPVEPLTHLLKQGK